jgi:hypothetical protein
MEFLLRIAAVLVLVVAGVTAIELLPQRGGLSANLGEAFDCVTRDRAAAAQAPGAAPAAALATTLTAAGCERYIPSFFAAVIALIGSLLLGGFASVVYNTRRFREILEQFAAGAASR